MFIFIENIHHHQSSLLYKFKLFCITYNRNQQHSVIVLKCESQNTVLIIVKYNSPFDVLLHEITDAPPKNTTFLARPTRSYYQSPMSILFLISSLTSSILSGYVLSQLLSLLTRSCVIKYNTGTYQHTYIGCDAERYRWRCRWRCRW